MKYDIMHYTNEYAKKVGVEYMNIDQKAFEALVRFDRVNREGVPVLVYELNGDAVAFYDGDYEYGVVTQ
jgi:molybdate-binding protein